MHEPDMLPPSGTTSKPSAWLHANHSLQGKDVLALVARIKTYNAADLRATVEDCPQLLASFREKHLLQSYRPNELENEFAKLQSGYKIEVSFTTSCNPRNKNRHIIEDEQAVSIPLTIDH
jgi:hypothetical protein